ncbi:MAG: ribulose-phosphate 3-epimerase [Clostridia bacterium]|nr:ribulose-phosphate 3-epimerase [Clostridia bacterium]
MVEISTSLLSVEKEKSIKVIYDLEVAHTDYYHIDVMDGEFVENDTRELMKSHIEVIKQISNIPIDVHLMVQDVKKYVYEYLDIIPNIITFQYEALKDKQEVKSIIDYIKKNNVKVGLAIKPKTELEEIYEFLPYIHMLLIMTVEPGKGGQALIPETLDKVRVLKSYINENNLEVDIEADGGIKLENIKDVKEAGVDIAVVGTGIIKTDNYKETIKRLKE